MVVAKKSHKKNYQRNRPQQKRNHKGLAHVEAAPGADEGSDLEVAEEDLEFVRKNKRRLSFLSELEADKLGSVGAKKVGVKPKDGLKEPVDGKEDTTGHAADDEEGMEEYERQPRSKLEEERQAVQLPIKTLEGAVMVSGEGGGRVSGTASQAPVVSGVAITDEWEEQQQQEDEAMEDAAAVQKESSKKKGRGGRKEGTAGGVLEELQRFASKQQRQEALKQRMAVAATKLLEKPETHLADLKELLLLCGDEDSQVSRLAMLTCLSVYRDILPGYRIRLPTESELSMPLSKEVKKLREYENTLLRCYQSYLKHLFQAFTRAKAPGGSIQVCRVCIRCMASLLVALHHFNYSADIMQVVVPNMVNRDADISKCCQTAVADLIQVDPVGQVSLEAIQLVADLVKKRQCRCPPGVVCSLLVMKFDETLPPATGSKEGKKGKQRKKAKKGKPKDEVDASFRESAAVVDSQEKRRLQSLQLEALFEIFFRVVKHVSNSPTVSQASGVSLSSTQFRSRFPLLWPALEGLAKYCHLISVEYFNDLMAVLQGILGSTAVPVQERMRCLITCADVLRGQGEALNIDRREFYMSLYALLLDVPLQPLTESAAPLDEEGEEDERTAANGPSPAVPSTSHGSRDDEARALLTGPLQTMLLGNKTLDVNRLAGFVHRIAGVSLYCSTGEALGALAVAYRVIRRNPKLCVLLDDAAGPGPAGLGVRPDAEDPAECGGMSTPLWELTLIRQHYHPHMAQASADLSKLGSQGNSGGGGSSIFTSGLDPSAIAAAYDTSAGRFKPSPTPPDSRKAAAGQVLKGDEMSETFVEATGCSTSDPADEQAVDDELEAAVRRHYRMSSRYQENASLRRELKRVQRELNSFQDHLRSKGQSRAAVRQLGHRIKPAAVHAVTAQHGTHDCSQNGVQGLQQKGGRSGAKQAKQKNKAAANGLAPAKACTAKVKKAKVVKAR